MFESTLNNDSAKLPTIKQYLKDNPQSEPRSWIVNKILWGDKFRSITFFTEAFRYSIKFQTPDEYKASCAMILDEFQMQGENIVGYWTLYFEPDSEKVMIDMEPPQDGKSYSVWKQWDWGLTCDSEDSIVWKAPKPKATKAKNPPAS